MIPRHVRIALPTGRRVRVRADLSVRVMLRSGLIKQADEEALLDALDDVSMDDREMGRRLQDALVMHALSYTKPSDLDAFAEAEFLEILGYAIRRLTPSEVEDDDAEVAEVEDDEEVLGVTEPDQDSLEDELERARAEQLPEIRVPQSAEVLDELERMEAQGAE